MKNRSLIACVLLLALCAILMSLSACDAAVPPGDGAETTANQQPTADPSVTTAQPEATEPEGDGSLSAPDYSISVVDGLYYLNFTEQKPSEEDSDGQNGDDHLTAAGDFLVFSSVADMKRAFVENTLTEEQKGIIQAKFNKTDNGYELCDLDQLVCPVFPEELSEQLVYLYGRQYRFYASGAGELAAGMVLRSESLYEQKHQSFMEIIEEHTLLSHTTEEYDGVACESYVFSTEVSEIRYVFMTLPSAGGSTAQRAIMRFVLNSGTQPDKASATVPASVYVYGELDGTFYECTIQGVSQAPTVEWLSSFTIEPYEDTPTAAVS